MSPIALLLVLALLCCSCRPLSALPTTRLGATIWDAAGVALSADGKLAFIHSINYLSSIYVVPLPITSSSVVSPSPYWSSPTRLVVTYIAASSSASPQLVFLLDGLHAQLLSLVINTTSPATNTSLLYDFGAANAFTIDGMFLQASTQLLFLSCYGHFDGAASDFIGWLDPSAPSPVLQRLYTTQFVNDIAAVAVSSAHLYFGTVTSPYPDSPYVAEVWRVPLISPGSTALIPNTTQPELLYTTAEANLGALVFGDLVSPAAFVLSADESVLYMTDMGNEDDNAASSPRAVYALWPLYGTAPLNLTALYESEGSSTNVMQSFALGPDQSTLYWAASGNRNGLYVTYNVTSAMPHLSGSTTSAAPLPSTSSLATTQGHTTPASNAPSASSATSTLAKAGSTSVTSLRTSSSATTAVLGRLNLTSTIVSAFNFSSKGDALSCLSFNGAATMGFAASLGGDIFQWSLTEHPAVVTPSYVVGDVALQTSASYVSCQANREGTLLYLLDSRHRTLSVYQVSTNTTPPAAPVVVASFPDEILSLSGVAIGFSSSMAYVGSLSGCVYAVNITTMGQSLSSFSAYCTPSALSAMTLSEDGRILYYVTPSPGTLYSLPLHEGGGIQSTVTPTLLFTSSLLVFPTSLVSQGSTFYIKDGGTMHGEADLRLHTAQHIYSLTLPNSLTAILDTTSVNLPPGLIMAADYHTMYFVTANTLNSLQLPSTSAGTSSLSSPPSHSSSPLPSSSVAPSSSSAAARLSSLMSAVASSTASVASATSHINTDSTTSSPSFTSPVVVSSENSPSTSSLNVFQTPDPPPSASKLSLSGGAITGIVLSTVCVAVAVMYMLYRLHTRRGAKTSITGEHSSINSEGWTGEGPPASDAVELQCL